MSILCDVNCWVDCPGSLRSKQNRRRPYCHSHCRPFVEIASPMFASKTCHFITQCGVDGREATPFKQLQRNDMSIMCSGTSKISNCSYLRIPEILHSSRGCHCQLP